MKARGENSVPWEEIMSCTDIQCDVQDNMQIMVYLREDVGDIIVLLHNVTD